MESAAQSVSRAAVVTITAGRERAGSRVPISSISPHAGKTCIYLGYRGSYGKPSRYDTINNFQGKIGEATKPPTHRIPYRSMIHTLRAGAGAPKPLIATIINAIKAAGLGGFLYMMLGDRFIKIASPPKSKILLTSYCVCVVVMFMGPLPYATHDDPLTDEEIANAAAEAEQTPAEYLQWLLELKTRQATQQLDAGVKNAERQQQHATKELQDSIEKAQEAKRELEELKAAAERMLKREQ